MTHRPSIAFIFFGLLLIFFSLPTIIEWIPDVKIATDPLGFTCTDSHRGFVSCRVIDPIPNTITKSPLWADAILTSGVVNEWTLLNSGEVDPILLNLLPDSVVAARNAIYMPFPPIPPPTTIMDMEDRQGRFHGLFIYLPVMRAK